MDSVHLGSFVNQCDEILGNLPSPKEKRKLLLTLLLLCQISSFSEKGLPEARETEPSVVQTLHVHPMEASFSQMWKNCVISNEYSVRHSLESMISKAADRIQELRGLLDPGLTWGTTTGQQLQRLLLLFDHSLHGERKELSALEILEALAARYPWEASTGSNGFYAPREVSELLADLLQPKGGTLYDPCCGSAGMLTSLANRMSNRGINSKIYGQESNDDAWMLAKLNLYFRGIQADLGQSPSYALADGAPETCQADFIIANPPFNDQAWLENYETLRFGSFLKYGAPPKKRGSLAWLQFMLHTLKPHGKLAALLNVSTLDSSFDSERRIRMGLVKDDLLEAIILLPAGLFYGTDISVSLWILQNGGKPALCGDRILMVDAGSLGIAVEKRLQLTEQDMQAILAVWDAYQRGESPEQIGFCTTVAAADVMEQDGTLYPQNYIPYAKESLPAWETLLKKESSLQIELQRQLQENTALAHRICDKYQKE